MLATFRLQISLKALQHLLATLQALLATSASGQKDVAAFLKPLVPHLVTMLLMAQAGDQLEYLARLTGKLSVCLTFVDRPTDGTAHEAWSGAGHVGICCKAVTLMRSVADSLPHAARLHAQASGACCNGCR